MTTLDSIILGVIQGITEFLPISSSGHLVVFEDWLDLPLESLKSFDVAIHVGTLFSILVYFWSDIVSLWKGFWAACRGKTSNEQLFGVSPMKFLLLLVVGTLPAVLIGLTLEDTIDGFFRDDYNIGYAFLYTATFFLVVEYFFRNKKSRPMSYWSSLVVGIFQAIAIVPGISRSGSTIGAGLMAGLERKEAAHFSFLLGIPALIGAGVLTSYKLFTGQEAVYSLSWDIYAVGTLTSFVSGYLSIYLLMKFLKKHSLAWFSVYLYILALWILL